jgi:hypothetical protein
MTENAVIPKWEDIPDRPPLQTDGSGEGTGLSAENIPKVKAAEIVGDDIAVVGYLILPNTMFEDGGDFYALIEIMDVDGNNFLFSTSSKALMRILKERHERDEIPFKTSLVMKKSKAGRSYYVFS